MRRIEREKQIVSQMIGIYCRAHHASKGELCADCGALRAYAYARLEHCRFGEQKTACKRCSVHCYKPAMREQMRVVMCYSGPRMLWYNPLAALRHLLQR